MRPHSTSQSLSEDDCQADILMLALMVIIAGPVLGRGSFMFQIETGLTFKNITSES